MGFAVGQHLRRLVLTSALLDAPQAQSTGLIDDIESPEALIESALKRAEKLARIPDDVYAFNKKQLHREANEQITTVQPVDDPRVDELWASSTVQERIKSYLESLQRR